LCFRRWAHEICADDNEERALVIASMNMMAYVLQAWLPLIVWQQVDAPEYQKGFITVSFLAFLLIVTAFVTNFLAKRQILRYELQVFLLIIRTLSSRFVRADLLLL
jgi:ACS family pantothenate transporter-like MFS transporter